MPSKSNQTTNRGRHVIEPLASTDVATGHTAVAVESQSERATAGETPAALRNQVRTIALESAVDLLAAEREELLEQVATLESKVEELEQEAASLERTVEYKDQRHRQVVERYERIIAEKDEAHRELERELEARPGEAGTGPGFSVRGTFRRTVRRLDDLRRR